MDLCVVIMTTAGSTSECHSVVIRLRQVLRHGGRDTLEVASRQV